MSSNFARRGAVVIETPSAKVTKMMLRNLRKKLPFYGGSVPEVIPQSTIVDLVRLDELRRSCGVEPKPTTIKWRRYDSVDDENTGG